MFAELHYPQSLEPSELDAYLSNGWFRMGQTIFTTNFLRFQDHIYSAIWLRIDLKDFKPSKTHQKLAKLNSKFRIEIQAFQHTKAHEVLFAKYKKGIQFETASSLESLLYHDGKNDIYNSFQVCIYDGLKLIACGIFDLGQEATAGITCFYDHEYKKYSLGKYLMYLKMAYSFHKGFRYFYTGYFAPGYTLFDYKLELSKDKLAFYDIYSGEWLPITHFETSRIPYQVMFEKLRELELILKFQDFKATLFKYPFFDTELNNELNGAGLFDFPVFIYCFDVDESLNMLTIVYDVRDEQYHILACHALYRMVHEINDELHYRSHLLEPLRVVYSSNMVEDIAMKLIMETAR